MKNRSTLYLRWIKNILFKHHLVSGQYNELIAYLFTKVYTPAERDINRYNDGVNVRSIFCDGRKHYHTIEFMSEPCTVLEMLLGLAFRLKSMTESDTNPHQVEYWFWTMISNLGLIQYTDYNFNENDVAEIIYRFVNGSYSSNGDGGLFCLPHNKMPEQYDMSTMDIWSQAMLYINQTSDSSHLF